MRRLATLLTLLTIALAAACGGGGNDDDGAEQSPAGPSGSDSPVATSSSSGGSTQPNAEFCTPDDVDFVFDSLDFATSSASLEDQADALGDALDGWAEGAPDEIREDIDILVAAVRGLFELLEEYEFDFLAIGSEAADDPRLAALDSDTFEQAAAALENYCGFNIGRPAVDLPQGTDGSGAGAFTSGSLPDDFPEELIPPDSELELAGSAGPAITAQFHSTATLDTIRDFYEDTLGDATVIDSQNMLWSVFDRGIVTTVTVGGEDGDIFIGVAIAGG